MSLCRLPFASNTNSNTNTNIALNQSALVYSVIGCDDGGLAMQF